MESEDIINNDKYYEKDSYNVFDTFSVYGLNIEGIKRYYSIPTNKRYHHMVRLNKDLDEIISKHLKEKEIKKKNYKSNIYDEERLIKMYGAKTEEGKNETKNIVQKRKSGKQPLNIKIIEDNNNNKTNTINRRELKQKILNVKLKEEKIYIVTSEKIYVFNLTTSQNIDTFDTITNKKGMIAVNGCPEKTIMAHPIEPEDDPDKGYVGIKNYKTNKYFPLLVHEEPISFIEMDYNGLLLASANDKGNIIRLHNLIDKTLVYECKRGKDKAIINYICFDIEYNYLGITSNKGTIHIWKLDDLIQKEIRNDGIRYMVQKKSGYKTEMSFAKIKINKPNCVFCFKPGNSLIIITQDEKFYTAKLDNKGGNINAIENKDFITPKEK